MRKILLFAFFTVIALSILANPRKNTDNYKIKVNYNLPRTVLDVKVTLERKVYHKGVYAKYAEKYLGISSSEVINADSESWSLSNIDISTHSEIDPSAFFNIEVLDDYTAGDISLSTEGFLLGFNVDLNQKEFQESTIQINDEPRKFDNIALENFVLDRPFKVVEDTTISIIEKDGEVQQKSKIKGKRQLKTEEEKASDAAHVIYKLRKRRFKILTCNYEHLPQDGQSYKQILENLDILEKKYLELFFGRESKEFISETYNIIPEKNDSSAVVTRYVSSKGFVGKKNVAGVPIILEFSNVNVDKNYNQLLANKSESGNYINYRIPASTIVHIYDGKKQIGYKNMIIPQFGEISYFSVEELLGNNLSVVLHPNYGSIKKLGRNLTQVNKKR